MCGRLGSSGCPDQPGCRGARHPATVRQGGTVLMGTIRWLSPNGACIDMVADSGLALGSWVVVTDTRHLRGGCEAQIVDIEGPRYRLAFDPAFVAAMAHFGAAAARRAGFHHAHEHALALGNDEAQA